MRKFRIAKIVQTNGLKEKTIKYVIQKRCLWFWRDYPILCGFNKTDPEHQELPYSYFNEKFPKFSYYRDALDLYTELMLMHNFKYKTERILVGYIVPDKKIVYFIKNKYMGYGYDNQDAFNYPRDIYDAIDKSIVCTTVCEV